MLARDVEDVALFETGGADRVERFVRRARLEGGAFGLRQDDRCSCRSAARAVAAAIGLSGAIVQAGGGQEIRQRSGRKREAHGECQAGVPE